MRHGITGWSDEGNGWECARETHEATRKSEGQLVDGGWRKLDGWMAAGCNDVRLEPFANRKGSIGMTVELSGMSEGFNGLSMKLSGLRLEPFANLEGSKRLRLGPFVMTEGCNGTTVEIIGTSKGCKFMSSLHAGGRMVESLVC